MISMHILVAGGQRKRMFAQMLIDEKSTWSGFRRNRLGEVRGSTNQGRRNPPRQTFQPGRGLSKWSAGWRWEIKNRQKILSTNKHLVRGLSKLARGGLRIDKQSRILPSTNFQFREGFVEMDGGMEAGIK